MLDVISAAENKNRVAYIHAIADGAQAQGHIGEI